MVQGSILSRIHGQIKKIVSIPKFKPVEGIRENAGLISLILLLLFCRIEVPGQDMSAIVLERVKGVAPCPHPGDADGNVILIPAHADPDSRRGLNEAAARQG